MLKGILGGCVSGLFYGFGVACLYLAAQCVRAWITGASVFAVFIPVLLLTAVAYFISGYFVFKML